MLPDRSTASGGNISLEHLSAQAMSSLSVNQFHELLHCSPYAIFCLDRNYNFVFANQLAMHICGTTELVGRNMWEMYPGNLAEPFYTSYSRTMQERVETEFEAFYGDPLNMWFRINARPVDLGMAVFFLNISKRKRAEELQERDARRLNQVLDVTSDGIVSHDRDWRIRFLNRRAEEMLAVKGDLIGKVLWEEFPAFTDPEGLYRKHCLKTMQERIPTYIEAFYPAPLDRYYAIESQPADDGIVQFFRDITERRLSEQAIETQQNLLRAVQQVALVASWTLDAGTGRIEFGPGSYPVFGHPLEDLSTLTGLLAIVLPSDRDNVLAVTREAVRQHTMFTVDFGVTSSSGETLFVECRGQVIASDAPGLRVGGIAIDISTRKRNERALALHQQETERQRAELETIYRTTDIGLALFSAGDFRCLRINDYEAEIIGLPQDQIIGKTLLEIAPDVPGLLEIFRGVEAGTPVRDMIVEGELPSRPGEPRVWSVSYAPVYGDDGKVVAITTASLEVTQQRRTQAALMHSEKLAAVGRLASSISHEINNPLESVTNLLYILDTDRDLPESLRPYVTTAQEQLSRVSQIAMQTLLFHRQASKPTRVTASTLASSVLDLYHGRLFNSGIQVDARYQTERTIICFENDIRQVLNNLIANAIDAMSTGGRLVIRAHEVYDSATGQCSIRLTVADTGHGMSRATADRIFDPFFTTKDLNGTGLGLWISAEIVARHHGKLRVRSSKSAVHRGTVFTLVLPCDETPEEAPNPSAHTAFAG